ncbi:MAG TPA: DNA methyltransferase [Rhodothermales bacterium]
MTLYQQDALQLYGEWPKPVVIISDGAYGVGGFPGDPATTDGLIEWYEPHVQAWSRYATGMTTLWFWNTELGWATVHPLLLRYGWEYVGCNIWDKGIAHIAGNSNTKTLRKFPVVTEVCVQYVKPPRFQVAGRKIPMKEWLRWEWQRAGLPFYRANEACGVRNAATRKYLTQDHLWYFPPPDAFDRLARYANEHGNPAGRPYYSLDGRRPLTAEEWAAMRSKFYLRVGVTNVWREPAVHGEERMKRGNGYAHANQKPLTLIERIIGASSEPGDVVWEPFGGLCTGALASAALDRECHSAEILPDYFDLAARRLQSRQLRLM